jgi:hypothetical protein
MIDLQWIGVAASYMPLLIWLLAVVAALRSVKKMFSESAAPRWVESPSALLTLFTMQVWPLVLGMLVIALINQLQFVAWRANSPPYPILDTQWGMTLLMSFQYHAGLLFLGLLLCYAAALSRWGRSLWVASLIAAVLGVVVQWARIATRSYSGAAIPDLLLLLAISVGLATYAAIAWCFRFRQRVAVILMFVVTAAPLLLSALPLAHLDHLPKNAQWLGQAAYVGAQAYTYAGPTLAHEQPPHAGMLTANFDPQLLMWWEPLRAWKLPASPWLCVPFIGLRSLGLVCNPCELASTASGTPAHGCDACPGFTASPLPA